MRDRGTCDAMLTELAARHARIRARAEQLDGEPREDMCAIADALALSMSQFRAESLDGVRAKATVIERQTGGRSIVELSQTGTDALLVESTVDDLIAIFQEPVDNLSASVASFHLRSGPTPRASTVSSEQPLTSAPALAHD